jgi:hypothetical protein
VSRRPGRGDRLAARRVARSHHALRVGSVDGPSSPMHTAGPMPTRRRSHGVEQGRQSQDDKATDDGPGEVRCEVVSG